MNPIVNINPGHSAHLAFQYHKTEYMRHSSVLPQGDPDLILQISTSGNIPYGTPQAALRPPAQRTCSLCFPVTGILQIPCQNFLQKKSRCTFHFHYRKFNIRRLTKNTNPNPANTKSFLEKEDADSIRHPHNKLSPYLAVSQLIQYEFRRPAGRFSPESFRPGI